MLTTDQITAQATCHSCDWRVQHTGPVLEVAAFLHACTVAHVLETHDAQLHPEDIYFVIDPHLFADEGA